MKKLVSSILFLGVLISCGETKEKKNDQNTSQDKPQVVETNKTLSSADYSSLLINYECDMTVAEVAKIYNIPETDVSVPEFTQAGICSFEIKGFGKNALGGTILTWGATPFSKADSKKEIQGFLKDQENNESMFGMGIELSETGDCYIARTPHVGRVIIYNENYDHAFYFQYSQKGIYKDRTDEQHAKLGEKTIALANYLLKKHKK